MSSLSNEWFSLLSVAPSASSALKISDAGASLRSGLPPLVLLLLPAASDRGLGFAPRMKLVGKSELRRKEAMAMSSKSPAPSEGPDPLAPIDDVGKEPVAIGSA